MQGPFPTLPGMSTAGQQAGWQYANALREIRGPLSVEKAARRVDVDRQTWTAWEKGTQIPRFERLKAIVEAFNVPPAMIGYEAPEGWELVPAQWIRDELAASAERARLRHDEVMQALRDLVIEVRANA